MMISQDHRLGDKVDWPNGTESHHFQPSCGTTMMGKTKQVAGVVFHAIGAGAMCYSFSCAISLTDCSEERLALSIGASTIYFISLVASRFLARTPVVASPEERYAMEMLRGKNPTFNGIDDYSSMVQLLDYLMNPADTYIVTERDFHLGHYTGQIPLFANSLDWANPLDSNNPELFFTKHYSWDYIGVREREQLRQQLGQDKPVSEQIDPLLQQMDKQISQQQHQHEEILRLLKGKLRNPEWSVRFENAIYGWIESSGISDKEAQKVLARFYELANSEDETLELVEMIIKGNYENLSIPELYRSLRYAVFYNKTNFLHSFDFGIEQKLKNLQKLVERMDSDRFSQLEFSQLESIKNFLTEIISCVQKLKVPCTDLQEKQEVNDFYRRWKELKASWKSNSSEELERLRSDMTPHLFQSLFMSKGYGHYKPISDTQRIMLAHALEIKSMLRNTHYTFIHGQSTIAWTYNALYKEIKKLEGHTSQMYHYLRYEDVPTLEGGKTADQWAKTKDFATIHMRLNFFQWMGIFCTIL